MSALTILRTPDLVTGTAGFLCSAFCFLRCWWGWKRRPCSVWGGRRHACVTCPSLVPGLLLSFPGSTDDASERFFLQTRPVVSGLPPCLRGTLEGPGLPGDVRKGPSACWSRLCPTSHRQGDSDVLARAGGDVPELSAVGRCALRRVEPLSGTPRGPPWDVHSHGGPPRTPPPPRPSVLVLTIHALWL
ncbi:unnamed protein product [Rangifer tarandus platyrhynchus]|uniref:Uncharacterized protein n=1 Tax=Rangifer tarandus platyrhynchus TaxID=3082113 RepID=A0ABN8YEV9_RANTA|nr:unnamed protein product [Rangifer tarandus platyrhynchus]